MSKMLRLSAFVASMVLFAACKKEPAAQVPVPTPVRGAVDTTLSHGGDTKSAAMSSGSVISGKITETMNAGGYTYMKLATAKGPVWTAIKETKVAKGDQATVVQAMLMTKFASPTLKRTFDQIYFGVLHGAPGGEGAMGQQAKGDIAAAHSRARVAAKAALDKPIAKAEGAEARTVAEIYAQRDALAGKTVVVRGKVTKYNGGIMDRNWLHLQDGSGSKDKSNFDLTVTTQGETAPGKIVVVKGTLRKNQDFGAGYSYAVLIENAKLQ